ncbi:hypothetical protein ANAEL_02631 [Anaerolineales bacterium]|nr:hypothetical protein ANAEL_02631 [Anaerolineales bacterium]
MSFLLIIHSYLRWLILIVALVAVIKFAIGWRRGNAFQKMDNGLASGFSGLMDLQASIGLIFLVWNGLAGTGFPAFRIEHTATMIIAAVVAHLHVLWKNADDKKRFRNSLFIILDTLIIVFIGVARLPGGWSR